MVWPQRASRITSPAASPAVLSVPSWIRVLTIVFVLVGCAARFVHLDQKGYTNDEATTSLHVAGHTVAGYADAAFDQRVRTVGELRRFQDLDPTKNVRDVVAGLAREDPQHPPLYYVLERAWVQFFGGSLEAKRSLSALFGVLAIPAVVWLGLELFGDLAPGLLAGAFLAVSPFHVVYAQQAREYALWTLLTALSCALLLAACRTRARGLWAIYALVIVLGLYTDPLFLTVLAAHVAYVAWFERKPRVTLVSFAAATIAALAAYAPWIAVLISGMRAGAITNNTYLAAGLPASLFVLKWVFNVGTLFYDLDYRWPFTVVVLVPVFVALLAAFVTLPRSVPARICAFVLLLVGIPVALLLIPDLLLHQTRSTSARYLVPAWLGIELILAWYVAREARAGAVWRRRATAVALTAYLSLAAASSLVGTFATSWWADGSAKNLRAIAQVVAAADRPLIVYHATWAAGKAEPALWDFTIVQLIDELPDEVRVQQLATDAPLRLPVPAGTAFLLDPTPAFRARLEAHGAVLVPIALHGAGAAEPVRELRAQARATRTRSGYTEAEQTLWRIDRAPTVPS